MILFETLLGQPGLGDSRPSIRVHADKNSKTIDLEGEQTLVRVSALVSEILENLLKRGLGHRVLRDVELCFLVLDCAENESNRSLILGHSELVEVTALLKNLDLVKETSEAFDEFESVLLDVQEGNKVHELNLTIVIKVSFNDQVRAETVSADAIKDKWINLGLLSAGSDCTV